MGWEVQIYVLSFTKQNVNRDDVSGLQFPVMLEAPFPSPAMLTEQHFFSLWKIHNSNNPQLFRENTGTMQESWTNEELQLTLECWTTGNQLKALK